MKSAFSALLLAASLTGCATSWVVDSDVKSFSSLGTVPPGATYRFDRLPSQQADGARQESLEAMAGAALDQVGLRRDDAKAQYTAQIGARVTAGHFIFIPAVLLVGIVIGWVLGSRAARDAYAMEL